MRKQMDMSETLNRECKAYAKKEGMLLNAFIIKCIERGLNYYKTKLNPEEEEEEEAIKKTMEQTKRLWKK